MTRSYFSKVTPLSFEKKKQLIEDCFEGIYIFGGLGGSAYAATKVYSYQTDSYGLCVIGTSMGVIAGFGCGYCVSMAVPLFIPVFGIVSLVLYFDTDKRQQIEKNKAN